MKAKIIIFYLFVNSIELSAQNFTGQIFDFKTREPISYANIGIIGKGIGTISDKEGNFSLFIEDKYRDDTLKITLIGYKYICFKVSDLKSKYDNSSAKFYLEESSYSLNEIVVRPFKYKTSVVGNTDLGSPCVTFIGDTLQNLDGCEIGTLIEIKNRPTFIDKIKFGVCQNDFDSLTLRLNIYSKDNVNVLKQPIYITLKKGEREVTINTKPYNIKVEDDFIIAFEALQILQTKNRKSKIPQKKFSFSGGLLGSDMLLRMNIYDKWEKANVVVIGFNATISYQEEDKGNWFQRLFK